MREFSSKSPDFVTIALRTAIAKEGKHPLLAVSEDGSNVKRTRPLEVQTDSWSRTVYVVSGQETCGLLGVIADLGWRGVERVWRG
jgi:hypothetical protein